MNELPHARSIRKFWLIALAVVCVIHAPPSKANIKNCSEDEIKDVTKFVDTKLLSEDEHDLEELVLFVKEACGDDEKTYNLLGVLYLKKEDQKSVELAKQYFLKAIQLGVKAAYQNLAELYFFQDNLQEATKYLKPIETFGYQMPSYQYINWARLYAQILYLSGPNNPADTETAISLFRKIKDFDDSGVSHYFIGHWSHKRNDKQATTNYLKRASQQGHLNATMLLADLYYMGFFTTVDLKKAKQYYKIAALKDSGRAYYNLAMIARAENDIKEMKQHLTKSANLGFDKAIKLFEQLSED